MERRELITILKYLRDNYPYRSIDAKDILDTWEAEFGGLPAEVLGKAVRFHVRKSKSWPTIAHIREIISRNLQGVYETKVAIEARAIEEEKVINFEDSMCQMCPYLQEGQTEPCEVCISEGRLKNEDQRTAGS